MKQKTRKLRMPAAWIVTVLSFVLVACSGQVSEEDYVQAARHGDVATVKRLLQRGVDVNAVDARQQATALMWAAHEGHTDIMAVLIQYGANIDARKTSGETALWFAAQQGQLDALKVLVQQGADINVRGWEGASALEVAEKKGHQDIVDYLKAAGVAE